MLITFKTDGGFAYLPGLNRPITIDTGELSEEEAGKMEQLVEAAGFFELPETQEPRRGADLREYTISVSYSGRERTVKLVEPIEDASVQALVDHLRMKARRSRLDSSAS